MRVVIILVSFFISIKLFAQDSVIRAKLNQIEKIPCTYLKHSADKQLYDNAFKFILERDTLAIPSLINLLLDTSFSKVKDLNTNTYYKKGDLAFILINYIEFVPFALITHSQWCMCCDCGNLPMYFLEYLDINRLEFQQKYKSYFISAERRKYIIQDSKKLKKKRNR